MIVKLDVTMRMNTGRTFHDIEIPTQSFLKHWMPEQTALGNIAHEQLHNSEELVYCLVETRSGLGWRCTSDGLLQVRVCCSVIQLHGPNTADVVMVSGVLRVSNRRGKSSLQDEHVGLVVQAVLEIVMKQAVQKRCLRFIVVA